MKKVLCMTLALVLLACPGCKAPEQPGGETGGTASFTYTNLDSEDAQGEVRNSLTEAGIREEYVDTVLGWAVDYNSCMRECEAFSLAGDFVPMEGTTVDYGEYYPMMTEWYRKQGRDYSDILCRVAAFALVRDMVSVEKVLEKEAFDCWDENHSWLFSDGDIFFGREAVEGEHKAFPPSPLIASWDEDMVAEYFTLFEPLPVNTEYDEEEMVQAIQDKWREQGISFQEGSYSLITFWRQNSGKMAVSHAAVLAETGEGYLLFEKTNPLSPYAATRFSSTAEVKQYLYDMMALDCARYDSPVGTYVILQNGRPL